MFQSTTSYVLLQKLRGQQYITVIMTGHQGVKKPGNTTGKVCKCYMRTVTMGQSYKCLTSPSCFLLNTSLLSPTMGLSPFSSPAELRCFKALQGCKGQSFPKKIWQPLPEKFLNGKHCTDAFWICYFCTKNVACLKMNEAHIVFTWYY